MVRIMWAGVLVLGLGACAAPPEHSWWRDIAGLGGAPGTYRFDWRIAGEPALAPLQVFDDGHRTWLQYPAEQPVPALFDRTPQGDRLMRPRREGDYLILSGVPAKIVLRGGLLQAEAWRPQVVESGLIPAGSAPIASQPAAMPVDTAAPVTDLPRIAAPAAMPSAAAPVPPPVILPVAASAPESPVPIRAPAPPPRAAASQPVALPGVVAPVFEVTPADGNIRRALVRWARTAGWTFDAGHWAVDVDIPLAGSAVFEDSFLVAVRGLLAATELGDRPVQPCFYANRVLRVVPLAQRCDRTQTPGAAS